MEGGEAMERQPEPEYMDLPEEALAYAQADFADVNAAFVERLLKLAGGQEAVSALDLGAGPADIPLRVAEQRPHWRQFAVDAAISMLRLAEPERRRAARRVVLVQADAKRLPFPDHSIQTVYSNSILHHVLDPHAFWSEVRRVLRPGGLIFLRDLSRPPSPQAAQDLIDEHAAGESDLLREEFYRSLLAAYTPEEVRAQLRKAGLEGLEVRQITDRHLDAWGQPA
jgi:ubiquinone/menaquinone biosynthesis C-methylase UbiE